MPAAPLYDRIDPSQSTPFWDGSTPAAPGFTRYPPMPFPRGGTSTSSFIQFAGLRRFGVSGLGETTTAEGWGYAVTAALGAAFGGAILGYVAAGDREGAMRGGSLALGLSALSDGFYFARAQSWLPATFFGLTGALGTGYAIQRWRKGRRKR